MSRCSLAGCHRRRPIRQNARDLCLALGPNPAWRCVPCRGRTQRVEQLHNRLDVCRNSSLTTTGVTAPCFRWSWRRRRGRWPGGGFGLAVATRLATRTAGSWVCAPSPTSTRQRRSRRCAMQCEAGDSVNRWFLKSLRCWSRRCLCRQAGRHRRGIARPAGGGYNRG